MLHGFHLLFCSLCLRIHFSWFCIRFILFQIRSKPAFFLTVWVPKPLFFSLFGQSVCRSACLSLPLRHSPGCSQPLPFRHQLSHKPFHSVPFDRVKVSKFFLNYPFPILSPRVRLLILRIWPFSPSVNLGNHPTYFFWNLHPLTC